MFLVKERPDAVGVGVVERGGLDFLEKGETALERFAELAPVVWTGLETA